MARPKRNASQAGLETATAATPAVKKGRRANARGVTETAATNRPRRSSAGNGDIAEHKPKKRGRPPKATSTPKEPIQTQKPITQKTSKTGKLTDNSNTTTEKTGTTNATQMPEVGARGVGRKGKARKTASKEVELHGMATQERRGSDISVEVPSSKAVQAAEEPDDEDEDEEGTSYWLMKAEPDSRIEKGRDVKFSIDDLRNAKEPEGWDGVRNATARNNMRAMRKGDLAFFYHSNTKVPGIAGVMEIVREHSVDDTAFDPGHPYYDPKSVPEKPKWDMVHVEFRQKFDSIVRLKDLQKFSKPGGVLEAMQTLKQSRLSVSKVTKKEWQFIMSLAEVETKPETSDQAPVEQDNPHKNGVEGTVALSATDNTNPATNGADENPADVHPNGVLPDRVREHEVTGEEEVTPQEQPAAKDEDLGNGVLAPKADETGGRVSRKSKR